MQLIAWDAKYSVKVREFDAQHKMLFHILNRLHEAMLAGQARTVLAKILDELVNYTQNHFTAEEALLQAKGYPDLAKHRTEHRHLIEAVHTFKCEFEAGAVAISIDLMDFLRNWLDKHIRGTDQNYAAFLNAKGVS